MTKIAIPANSNYMKNMIKILSDIAIEAGEKIIDVRAKGFEVEFKADKSPVTEADKASNSIILERLKQNYPDIPIISEEIYSADYKIRKEWKDFFLVDPLDGTKEFIKDNGEFCVCIAYMHEKSPALGVIYAPVQKTLYAGGPETGSFISRNREELKPIKTIPPTTGEALTVVGSRSHPSPNLGKYLEQFKVKEIIPAGSAIKFCLVAEGRAHLYPRFNPTMEWDTAAGEAIVTGAGGSMTTLEGEPFPYNKRILKNGGFIVKA